MSRSTARSGPASWWRSFAARYGWRAYAVPVLAALTVAVLLRGTPAPTAPRTVAEGTPPKNTAAVAGFDKPATRIAALTIRTTSDVTGCTGNTYARLAIVSRSKQRVWMCDKQQQVYTTPVTTGATTGDYETPLGSWRVQSRERDRYLVGPGYKDYVHFWVPFNGDFGFHDASWQTMAFGSPNYTTQGSHGCVHMPMAAMKWFYDWAKVGQTVVTIAA